MARESAASPAIAQALNKTGSQTPIPKRDPNDVSQAGAGVRDVSNTARRLADLAVAKNDFDRTHRDAAPAIFQDYLNDGWTEAEIEHVIATAPTLVRSASYYKDRLSRGRSDLRRKAPTITPDPAISQQPEHPKMLEQPGWQKHPCKAQILLVLKAMDEHAPAKRAYWLTHWSNHSPEAFEAVARRYPEIREMARFDPLREPD